MSSWRIFYHIFRSGRSARGGRLPVIRCLAGARPGAKPRCDIDFAAFYLFARAAWPLGKKGGAAKSGRPRGFAPSLIMLRSRPAPHALRQAQLSSLANRPRTHYALKGDSIASDLPPQCAPKTRRRCVPLAISRGAATNGRETGEVSAAAQQISFERPSLQ